MGNLITPTLMDSLDWLYNSPPSWKEKAYEDMLNKLNRVFTSNIHVEKGQYFERVLYENCKKDPIPGSDYFREICNCIKGGTFQSKGKIFETIRGENFCLFGRFDVLFPNLIIDIKTTSNWKGKSKYLKGWQHKFYCLIKQIHHFKYIVAEWSPDWRIKNVHYIDYHVDSFEGLRKEVKEKIEEFLDFLEMNPEYKEAYYEKFNLY